MADYEKVLRGTHRLQEEVTISLSFLASITCPHIALNHKLFQSTIIIFKLVEVDEKVKRLSHLHHFTSTIHTPN